MTDERVDHPKHYGGADDPYETIKVLAAWYAKALADVLAGP